ncbi:hypothetical protein PLANPX_6020 [Lacipirellula parvula]|uniref:Uncharacterized protein n=1 Tax=Lacipirellula parvula TaxID=2650471 RepID=A0A5K7XIV0_9BACT|nr:hypothetical protein PLANPX_6020 [Lacipirellula parvula]
MQVFFARLAAQLTNARQAFVERRFFADFRGDLAAIPAASLSRIQGKRFP